MKTYLFSIFTRCFIALSGFLVFVISAKLFGPAGRGIISYGTSLFASIAILFSFNLGRAFLAYTLKEESLKREALPWFLFINYMVSTLTFASGLIFWCFSASAQATLSFENALGFSLLSFFFVWFHNGHPFFSSFSLTHVQDKIIFYTRIIMVAFLGLFWISGSHNINQFIYSYSSILFLGFCVEVATLIRATQIKLEFRINFKKLVHLLGKSLWTHIDFISFNTFPLGIIILSASFITKEDIGRANFVFQILNVIFLLSTTANIRINSYIAIINFREKLNEIRKLFWFTLIVSCLATIVIYFGLGYVLDTHSYKSFTETDKLLLLAAPSVFGYIAYQFLNPIWIELKQIKKIAILNFIAAAFCLAITPYFLSRWATTGLIYSFTLFHLLIFLNTILLLAVSLLRKPKKMLANEGKPSAANSSKLVVQFFESAQKQAIGGVEATLHDLEITLRSLGCEVERAAQTPKKGAICHFHGIWSPRNSWLAFQCLREKIPFICSPHGSLEPWAFDFRKFKKIPYFHLIEKRWLAKASCLLTANEKEAQNICKLFPQTNVQSIPLGIILPPFTPKNEARLKLGWKESEKVILFLSRIHPVKGLPHLIEALKDPIFREARVRLVIVGDGDKAYVQQLKKSVETFKDELPEVTWIGPIWGEEKFLYFSAADLYCLPSHSENFGLTVLEALTSGTRVLTTTNTPWAFIGEWKAGWISELTPLALREKLKDWLKDTSDSNELREWIRRKAISKFSWDQLGPSYYQLYSHLVSKDQSLKSEE